MLNYGKMFDPYTTDGCTLDMCIAWVKEKTKADDNVLELAVARTMLKVAQGESFPVPCECGCGGKLKNVHTPISHDMLIEAAKLKAEKDANFAVFIEERQKQLVETHMKHLSGFDKKYDKRLNGTRWQRFKKFVGLIYEHWENE